MAMTLPDGHDDTLTEILIRLPRQPSSLIRAAAVCKRWRRLISDPDLVLRRFRAHHRTPPLLGFFLKPQGEAVGFIPMLGAPDRIPFSLTPPRDERWSLKGCRHGLALFLNWTRLEAVVWDPATGHQRAVPFPPGFGNDKGNLVRNAAVVCADTSRGHAHGGGCHSSPFKLVLLRNSDDRTQAFACLYESNSGVWGDIISTEVSDMVNPIRPGILVGNALYWMLLDDSVLEFDLGRQSLDVIEKPANSHAIPKKSYFQVLRTEQNRLGLAILTGMNMELWGYDGTATWVLQNIVDLRKLLELRSWREKPMIRGFDEDNNVILVYTDESSVFMVNLESMQFKYVGERTYLSYYPYSSFYYTAGNTISLQ